MKIIALMHPPNTMTKGKYGLSSIFYWPQCSMRNLERVVVRGIRGRLFGLRGPPLGAARMTKGGCGAFRTHGMGRRQSPNRGRTFPGRPALSSSGFALLLRGGGPQYVRSQSPLAKGIQIDTMASQGSASRCAARSRFCPAIQEAVASAPGSRR